LVAFGETSISACNNRITRKQRLRWATPQTSTLVSLHQKKTPTLVPKPRKPYIGSSDRDYYIGSQTKTFKLPHPTGNSALVLLTGKATLLPTLFFALRKQDSASGSFKQQFPLNLHSVSVVHFALIDANWRRSSFSRGFGLLGFCWPRIWIHVLRRSLELSGSIAPFL